ncbi:MAG: hypothetical protein GY947_13625 [Rhodobacteraceae bacterium]|nr:hypothetical protein [Paracoccaceae bacterium]
MTARSGVRRFHFLAVAALGAAGMYLIGLSGAGWGNEEKVDHALWDGVNTRAITGDRILFKGQEMKFTDLSCPSPETEAGRDAKALMNTFLRRAGYFECHMTSAGRTGWQGWCTVSERKGLAGKNIAEGMVQSGLCT